MTAKAERQQAVAREHGMSFEAVLRSYASAGYGIDTTARIIGYTPANLRRLLKRHDNFGIKWPTLKEQYAAGRIDNGGAEAYARRGEKIRRYHERRRAEGRTHPSRRPG